MLKSVLVASIMLSSVPASAIRWDFDDGTTQGWSAKEDRRAAREFNQFRGEVEAGVWRISVDPAVTKILSSVASGELISSTIGYDSGLFDHFRIRFRTVHDHPTEGRFGLGWENASGFKDDFETLVYKRIVYTTEWQEVVISLDGQEGWEGLLKKMVLNFSLGGSATEVVEWFEVDWIELTGVEEQLQGELPPPPIAYFRFAGADLFVAPVFYPIAPGTGQEFDAGGYLGDKKGGVLTDLDGDGDLDLFGLWSGERATERGPQYKSGWLMAVNDGRGILERGPVIEEVGESSTAGSIIPRLVLEVVGADLTGDGKNEIAITINNRESPTEVWSVGPELQVEVLAQMDRPIHGVADWDGDSRGELFVGGATFAGSFEEMIAGTAEFASTLAVWDVEQGVWTVEEVGAAQDYTPLQIGDFTRDGILDVLWGSILGREDRWIVGALGEELHRGEVFEFAERKRLLGVGDFDGDGQVDFLTEFTNHQIDGSRGLVLQRKGAGDRLAAEVLYDDRLLRRSPVLVTDLNGDGVDDWVFIGGDRASGFGVFVEWGGSVQPTQAGERYRLAGTPRHVLAGDMDNDGDVDLVVLDPILGGVHLLKSTLAEQATAVLTPAAAQPAQHRLGDSYPNPFNPAVVLPLDLATDAARVSLTVYDVLGRRVRQVRDGPLQAGSHRFTWDGRDEQGRAVAAGVYVYQVAVDGQVEAKKATKLP
ncbi:MAG: T9SS type A sorting domain-containing protein [Gemmatimonadetes bacterium]|nr:T9SS type A sorting domain-containing protein [Gemmatimonadota bacterium]